MGRRIQIAAGESRSPASERCHLPAKPNRRAPNAARRRLPTVRRPILETTVCASALYRVTGSHAVRAPAFGRDDAEESPNDEQDAAPRRSSAFSRKLERLNPTTAPATSKPTLDELRGRIAAVLQRDTTKPAVPRVPFRPSSSWDGSFGALPFLEEHTESGPLYLARKRAPLGSRFGLAPLYPAVLADVSLLSLLAFDPSLAAVDPRRRLYLDTETTGLSGGTGTVAFLVGMAFYDEAAESFVVEQLLLRDLGEETPMLEVVADRIARASAIVTFNGKAFDLPLLAARAVMNRLPPYAARPRLDLLHVARRVHKGTIESCALRHIEANVLGHERFEDVAGQDIPLSYFHYLRSGNEMVLAGVVEHNMNDVLAMIALVGFYGERIEGATASDAEGSPSGGALPARDLVGVASTLRRAGALDLALVAASSAVARGGGARARRVRGDIEKARGDKLRAIAEYEAAAAEIDDPSLRLALAKLYEHAARSFDKALDLALRGTGEGTSSEEKRRERLVRKLDARRTNESANRARKRGSAGS